MASSSLKCVVKCAVLSGSRVVSSYLSEQQLRNVASVVRKLVSAGRSDRVNLPSEGESHAIDKLERVRQSIDEEMKYRRMLGLATPSPFKIALLGGPGVGKGTWGSLIAKRLSVPHVSTGELVRSELSKPLSDCNEKMRDEIKSSVNEGKLLPDHVIVELLLRRMRDEDPSAGFVLDGFPRTLTQARILDEATGGIDVALNLQLDKDALLLKCLGRRVCRHCGKDYNLANVDVTTHKRDANGLVRRSRIFLPARLPPQECAVKLEVRADDANEQAVRERLRAFAEERKPMEEYYHAQNRLTNVNVGPGAEYVWPTILDVIRGLEAEPRRP
ncbi:hypothetical protein KP509_14G026100 [Ceratopteris richardii]|uniref:adenylate kinase n=1 Tax=Ceratopteris richardii TaxID=49495 RepID=A0A8T2TB26_CERRI|nr:hypothetical protein KP509_14G026100 [Ceratopteris richardii]